MVKKFKINTMHKSIMDGGSCFLCCCVNVLPDVLLCLQAHNLKMPS